MLLSETYDTILERLNNKYCIGNINNFNETAKLIGKKSEYLRYDLINLKFKGMNIGMQDGYTEDDLDQVEKDLKVLNKRYMYHFKNDFIAYLKTDPNYNGNLTDEEIFNDLKIYEVDYSVFTGKAFNPFKNDTKYGVFSICYEPVKGSAIEEELVPQPVEMIVSIQGNKSKCTGNDI